MGKGKLKQEKSITIGNFKVKNVKIANEVWESKAE